MPIDRVSSARPPCVQRRSAVRAARGAARAAPRSPRPAREWPSGRAVHTLARQRSHGLRHRRHLSGATPLLLASPLMLTCRHTCSGGRSGGPLLGQALRDLQPVHRCAPSRSARPPAASCCSAAGRSVPRQRRGAQVGQRASILSPAPPARSSRRRRAGRRQAPRRTASAPKVLLTASSVTLCAGRPGGVAGACDALRALVVSSAAIVVIMRLKLIATHRRTPPMDITQLLAFSVKNKASDLHLSAGLPPMIRVHGDVRRINVEPLDHKQVHAMVYDIMNDTPAQALRRVRWRCDFSLRDPGPGALSRQRLQPEPRRRRGVPHHSEQDPDAGAAERAQDLRRPGAEAARHGAGDRPHRLGQDRPRWRRWSTT